MNFVYIHSLCYLCFELNSLSTKFCPFIYICRHHKYYDANVFYKFTHRERKTHKFDHFIFVFESKMSFCRLLNVYKMCVWMKRILLFFTFKWIDSEWKKKLSREKNRFTYANELLDKYLHYFANLFLVKWFLPLYPSRTQSVQRPPFKMENISNCATNFIRNWISTDVLRLMISFIHFS